jgi:hypothetical protein
VVSFSLVSFPFVVSFRSPFASFRIVIVFFRIVIVFGVPLVPVHSSFRFFFVGLRSPSFRSATLNLAFPLDHAGPERFRSELARALRSPLVGRSPQKQRILAIPSSSGYSTIRTFELFDYGISRFPRQHEYRLFQSNRTSSKYVGSPEDSLF